jgi:hypothetical protein
MHRVVITYSAEHDLDRGFDFYESQSAGLGRCFIDCLSTDIDSLKLFAGIHPKPFLGFHRTQSKRFPYSIYYDLIDGCAYVAAILDARQNPKTIHEQLQSFRSN